MAAQDAAKREMAYSDFLEELLKAEAAGRRVRKQGMLTRLAGFPAIKTLDDFDYGFAAGVKRSQIEELAGLRDGSAKQGSRISDISAPMGDASRQTRSRKNEKTLT